MPAWRVVLMMRGGRRVQVGVSLLVGLSGAVAWCASPLCLRVEGLPLALLLTDRSRRYMFW